MKPHIWLEDGEWVCCGSRFYFNGHGWNPQSAYYDWKRLNFRHMV